MSRDLKWDYEKFKKFDSFIREFKTYSDVLQFLNEVLTIMKEKKEFLNNITKLSAEEQLLLFYLKKKKNFKNIKDFYKNYVEFCQECYISLNNNLYESRKWEKQAVFHINQKSSFLIKLETIQANLVSVQNNFLN